MTVEEVDETTGRASMMRCPLLDAGSGEHSTTIKFPVAVCAGRTSVIETRSLAGGEVIRRRRQCLRNPDHRFSTYEMPLEIKRK